MRLTFCSPGELLDGHRWHLDPFCPVCCLRLDLVHCRGAPLTLELLLPHGLLRSSLLLLLNLWTTTAQLRKCITKGLPNIVCLSTSYLDETVAMCDPSKPHLLWISVEVEVRHDVPRVLPGDGSPHPENLPGQHPPHQTH